MYNVFKNWRESYTAHNKLSRGWKQKDLKDSEKKTENCLKTPEHRTTSGTVAKMTVT